MCAAANAALERHDLLYAVITDSADGRTLNEKFYAISMSLLMQRIGIEWLKTYGNKGIW